MARKVPGVRLRPDPGVEAPDLAKTYWPFFDIAQGRYEDGGARYDHPYFVAIDGEWTERGGRNTVLSYQTACLSRTDYCNSIHFVRQGDRLTLAELVERAIRSVNGGALPENHRGRRSIVVMVAHSTTAEWSILADRDAPYITKHLTAIRKSPVTTHPIKLILPGNFPVDVKIYDSMLLAPGTHRSLKKLSSLLGSKEKEKKDISEKTKRRMDLFLEEKRDEYAEYALRDTAVTLEIFLMLQSELNRQAFGPDKVDVAESDGVDGYCPQRLFRTLASAAVRGFLDKHGGWFEPYLEELRDKAFREAFKMVRRSYHGGRNEGYFVGDTSKHPETVDKVWLDIDFSGCFPGCMSLVPMIDTEGVVQHLTVRYQLDEERVARLRAANIPEDIIAAAVEGLAKDQADDEADVKRGSYFDLAIKPKPKPKKLTAHQSRLIREVATCYDDTLVKGWVLRWKKAQQDPKHPLNHHVLVGFARVKFAFPESTLYPCLPVRHLRFGLLYPLRGESVATAAEILLALEMGAKLDVIASVELPVALDENGLPNCYFREHLAGLIKKRAALEKREKEGDLAAGVGAKLLKEFVNSFYGKTAQAINPRKVYRPATGEMVPLFGSQISEASVASLTTGLARAALGAVLAAIERYNHGKVKADQVTVISGTTDGLLIGVKAPPGYSVTEKYYRMPEPKEGDDPDKVRSRTLIKGVKLQQVLEEFGCGELWKLFAEYLPLRQLQYARMALTDEKDAESIEVKHMADAVISIKTRGQIGLLATGEASILAKFGHKPPLSEFIQDEDEYRRVFEDGGLLRPTKEAEWLLEQIERTRDPNAEIPRYSFFGLRSFSTIYKSDDVYDLTQTRDERKFNADFDFKRKLERREPDKGGGISPHSLPHRDVAEMLRYRHQVENIRRTGFVAHPEKVLHRVAVKGRKARYRHGEPVTLVRQFLRGCRHGHIRSRIPLCEKPKPGHTRWNPDGAVFDDLVDRLNAVWEQSGLTVTTRKEAWSRDDFKNAGRPHDWEPGIMQRTGPLVELLHQLAVAFGADPEQAEQQLFAGDEHLILHREMVAHVTVAVLHAARERVAPFYELAKQGLLPDRTGLLRVFAPHLTEEALALCERARFVVGERPPEDRQRLVRLFRQIGLGALDATRCARALIQPKARGRRGKNTAETTCLEQFLVAIQQPDIVLPRKLTATRVIGKLARYKLSYSQFRRLQGVKFAPKSLANTPANRDQILLMATRLDLDPLPLIDALVDR